MKSVAKVAAPPTESKAPGKASCTGRPARLPRDARWGQSPAPLPAAAPGMAGNSAAPAARGRSDTFFPVEKRDLAEGAESQGCVLARGGWEVDGCRLQIRQQEGHGIFMCQLPGAAIVMHEVTAWLWLGTSQPGSTEDGSQPT